MKAITTVILMLLAVGAYAAATVPFETGHTYEITVTVPSGTPPFQYQWKRNGADIAGAIAPSYVATQPGIYSVAVSNSAGVTRSDDATLTAPPPPPPPPVVAGKGITAIRKIEPTPSPTPVP